MHTRRTLTLLGAGLAAWLAVSPASADKARDDARERFARGLQLFDQGDNGGALAEFNEAYDRVPHPLVLFNIGLTYVAMKRPIKAVETFDQLLAAPGKLPADRLERAKRERSEQAARIGKLQVTANIAGAKVIVDNQPRGTLPLSKPLLVATGTHVVSIEAPGHLPARREVTVAGKVTEKLLFELEPTEGKPALLRVVCSLMDVDVFVDNQKVGRTPLATPIALKPGQRQVELRRDGYRTASRAINVAPGSTGEVALTPQIQPGQSDGTLSLVVSESNAVVYVDGASQGAKLSLPLPQGRHRLRVERAGFHPYERTVNVRKGSTTTVTVPLSPEPKYRADYASSASTIQTVGWSLAIGGAAVSVGSVGFLVWNSDKIGDAEAEFARVEASFGTGGACDRAGQTDAGCLKQLDLALDDLDGEHALTKWGWVGLGTGVAIGATGVILLLTGDDPDRYEPKLDQDPYAAKNVLPYAWAAPGSGGVGLTGRF